MRVLLVEDDLMIGEAIRDALRDASYAVDWVTDGQIALQVALTQDYDIVLLDLGLPEQDGFSVLSSIRKHKNTVPLIIITARDALENRLRGLDTGADDYLSKPFELAELLARMRAVIRRKGGGADAVLSNKYVSLNPVTREATSKDGRLIQLSSKEFALLRALLVRPGAVLSRSELEDRLYGWGDEVESNAIEFLIHNLRKKLGNEIIKNIRGVGWMVSSET